MKAERHIFGSFRGYATLAASPGVSAEDARLLESEIYSFGQTYDPGFYESLPTSAPFFTTNLPKARRALTCVAKGHGDDAGRPTLLFITVVLSRGDWDGILLGDVAMLMKSASLWAWSGGGELASVELADTPSAAIISRAQVPRVLGLISQLERDVIAQRSTVIRESPYCYKDARAIEMLIPPAQRSRITTAFRALSPHMAANLICLAREADDDCPTVAITEGAHNSQYARALLEAGLASGVVPTALIRGYRW